MMAHADGVVWEVMANGLLSRSQLDIGGANERTRCTYAQRQSCKCVRETSGVSKELGHHWCIEEARSTYRRTH